MIDLAGSKICIRRNYNTISQHKFIPEVQFMWIIKGINQVGVWKESKMFLNTCISYNDEKTHRFGTPLASCSTDTVITLFVHGTPIHRLSESDQPNEHAQYMDDKMHVWHWALRHLLCASSVAHSQSIILRTGNFTSLSTEGFNIRFTS